MKVIKPVPITDANFVSSTVAETDHAAWSAATTYAIGDRVILTTGYHMVYESLQAGNLNHHPATDTSSPPFWIEVSPTNRWAMFDAATSTASTAATSMSVVVTPGLVAGLALLDLTGVSLTVTVRDGVAGPVVYTATESLEFSEVADWYDYFYAEFQQREEVVLTNLPIYSTCAITVEITGPTVSIGTMAVGASYELGDVQTGATAGILDFSRKETDSFGTTTFVPRAFSKRANVSLVVQNGGLNRLQRILSGLRATPAVWIGSGDPTYGPLVVYGFYKDFSITIAYASHSLCSLDIEGLT